MMTSGRTSRLRVYEWRAFLTNGLLERVAVRVFVSFLEPVRRLTSFPPLGVDCNLVASTAKNNIEAFIDSLLL